MQEIVPYPLDPRYGVTRDGRVFRIVKAHRGRPVPHELKPWLSVLGYRHITLSQPTPPRKAVGVHRMVAMAFLPNPDGLSDVAHNNGVPGDNRLENLRWDTRAGNLADTVAHGTSNRGERHYRAKLKAEDVRFIRRALAEGAQQIALASRFQVTSNAIHNIANGKNWRHVS